MSLPWNWPWKRDRYDDRANGSGAPGAICGMPGCGRPLRQIGSFRLCPSCDAPDPHRRNVIPEWATGPDDPPMRA